MKLFSFLFLLFLAFIAGAVYRVKPASYSFETGADTTSKDTCFIIVPNAITPNGDGVNDGIIISHNCPITDFHFWIYDRWGIIIYETTGLKNGSVVDWDHQKYPADTYLWKLTGKQREKEIKTLGHFTLLK
ncbi:MAG: gliding motility-associated C-terminal domain-containing protein [Bacteroidota bacterium]